MTPPKPKMIEINGKKYTETEVYKIYDYQQRKFWDEDIDNVIDDILYNPDATGAYILEDPDQRQACKLACRAKLPEWIDLQQEVLSSNLATISILAENKIREVLKKIEEESN